MHPALDAVEQARAQVKPRDQVFHAQDRRGPCRARVGGRRFEHRGRSHRAVGAQQIKLARQISAAHGAQLGHGRQQGTGVGVLRRCKHVARLALFHLVAAVHHQHAVGHFGHHAHVVGDEDHAHVHLVLQLANELQDLRLNGYVQRGGGLVGNEQLRLAGQRHRNHHALAHAARQLVRKAVEHVARFRNAHQVQHAQRLGTRCGAVHALVVADGLCNLLTRREHGVQRRHGLLEDHGHIGAAHIAHGGVARLHHVQHLAIAAAQRGRSVHDLAPAVLHQAHQRQRGHRLARARLAHNRQRLTTVHMERQVAHRVHGPLGIGEPHGHVAHSQYALLGQDQRRSHGRRSRFHVGSHGEKTVSGVRCSTHAQR